MLALPGPLKEEGNRWDPLLGTYATTFDATHLLTQRGKPYEGFAVVSRSKFDRAVSVDNALGRTVGTFNVRAPQAHMVRTTGVPFKPAPPGPTFHAASKTHLHRGCSLLRPLPEHVNTTTTRRADNQLELVFRDLEETLLIGSIPIWKRACIDVDGNGPIGLVH